ncbi:hypothetical protein VNI00_004710 [Paramarasmius palmivorus]|uniref:Amidohydrolase-related domain-containing protein n=1 Tax=Paramarasmius palmivorus TaxID=297713 RepID=A0AAW0DHR2_9AGAR
MEKLPLPGPVQRRKPRFLPLLALLIPLACLSYLNLNLSTTQSQRPSRVVRVPRNAAQLIDKCSTLNVLPAPPPDFHNRTVSDRYDPPLTPKKPILIRNATIWTGEVAEGLEIVFGDVLFDKGVIRSVGPTEYGSLKDVEEIDVNGAWVTPGIVDLHSHIGVGSSPGLSGSSDTNSRKGITQPWLRSLDGLNTYDESYRLSRSGGVTTAVVLPGSANAIGGQAFPIKLRPTSERSSSSLLLEPPFSIDTLNPTYLPGRWRQLKQACGENPSRVYSGTRMDTIWAFRAAYEEARKLKVKQDAFCENVLAGSWTEVYEEGGEFPDDLQWEALVDVLRGRVKIQNHCYEPTDLDGIVRLTNEFNFSIAAFHHASEAYLVPNLLKKAFGHTPGIALFATNARFKRESYRASEYAPAILASDGIDVVLKSDHPVTNSRHLIFEAQQAFYYGLSASLALASVTTTPAKIAGLDHRVGKVKAGWDADLVIWDSHPLALSSTPLQVFIDGIPQLDTPSASLQPSSIKTQSVPRTPDWEQEAQEAIAFDGLPPLEPKREVELDEAGKGVVFNGVGSLYLKKGGKVVEVFGLKSGKEGAKVVVEGGRVVCVSGVGAVEGLGLCTASQLNKKYVHVDLEGGSLSPGLTNYGSPLGLVHISGESSTQDSGGGGTRAVDGLLFGSRDALLAHHHGTTLSVTPPVSLSLDPGISTLLSTGSGHKLEKGAVVKDEIAAHVEVRLPDGSNGIGTIRSALEGGAGVWGRIRSGELPLVVEAHSADVIASLIELKRNSTNANVNLVVAGATEAHLLATELGEAGVGVLIKPSRPFPDSWEDVRLLPGPPLTPKSAIQTLLDADVTVGIGVDGRGCWSRNLRFDAGWAGLEAGLSVADALSLASTNVDKLFGIQGEDADSDLVATKGDHAPTYISGRYDIHLSPKEPILIRNATIWTGEVAGELEIVFGDVLFDKGIIRSVGAGSNLGGRVEEINVNGAWVTPGIVDLHSHLGVSSTPVLSGNLDFDSVKGITQPWLRSLDGLNTHDEGYRLSLAGGVTTALVLPGSDNAIGGQAFPIKLRPTSEKYSSSLLLEPPFSTETMNPTYLPGRWRQLKQACGENPSTAYNGTRMDTVWAFRAAYEEARKLKFKQDAFCENVLAGNWVEVEKAGDFPEDLQWETLVDVLRGRVKVQTHCYEVVDLDGIIRLTNEFNFSIAAFHHAHEAYLVPDLLKKAYGHTPAVAMFATTARYKREAYRGSEFAPRILADQGVDVVMKSDHPLTNSRYLLHEAQQAFYYGLNASLALASVTTTPARIAGLDHRVGKTKVGWDADIVIWDSHPLALGATPLQTAPPTPQWDSETKQAIEHDGLPSLEAKTQLSLGGAGKGSGVIFDGVASLYLKRDGRVVEVFGNRDDAKVVVEGGKVVCVADVDSVPGFDACTADQLNEDYVRVDLQGGSLSPGFTSYGAPLGLVHIQGEPSTQDSGGERAVDGLLFKSRDAMLAHRHGATLSITSPQLLSTNPSLSVLLSTGASNKLVRGAVVKDEVAVHVEVLLPGASSQIGALRRALLSREGVWSRVLSGELPLVVEAHSADVIASLLQLKSKVERTVNASVPLRLVLAGATEAHLVAKEIGVAGVGVVVKPSRPYPVTWQDIRLLPGPPLTSKTAIEVLLEANVTVGIGVSGLGCLGCMARNIRWDVGWAKMDIGLSTADALSLASSNIDALFNLSEEESDSDLVATRGGTVLDFEGKVVGVVSQRRGVVDLFE